MAPVIRKQQVNNNKMEEDSTISLVPIIGYLVIAAAIYWGGKYSYYRKMRRIKKNSVLSSIND